MGQNKPTAVKLVSGSPYHSKAKLVIHMKKTNRDKKVRMVWTTMKKLSYLVINGVLPLADVTSDNLTYLNLLENNHKLFALGNLLIMFFPFFFNEFCSLGEKCSLSQLPQR